MQSRSAHQLKNAAICAALVAMVWAVFGQAVSFGFVNYDDDTYIYNNPHIRSGLSIPALRWAFTHPHSDNWHPLTTLSHMLDCQLYGLHPWGHHLGNILLHSLTAALLFLALRELTGATWRSAFAAALFAIHPLRVESVAWISERKDTLSGLFFMLTLLAYARYVHDGRRRGAYFAVILSFTLALVSKPTVVPLPFLLLVLDYWPLARFPSSKSNSSNFEFRTSNFLPHAARSLFIEKLPLFALSAASCIITWWAQTGALAQAVSVTFPYRIANGVVAYATYVLQFLWPAGLAVLYPHPGDSLPMWQFDLALLLLGAISTAAFVLRKRMPWIAAGWLWYLGMLVPVIGIVQVGMQGHADRYTYLPGIGLAVAVAWTGAWIIARLRLGWPAAAIVSAAILCPLMAAAALQTTYWRDGETLWNRALDCTENNYNAHLNLGNILDHKGDPAGAIAQFQSALAINPQCAEAASNLGEEYHMQGRFGDAIAQFQRALAIKPDYSDAFYNYANTLLDSGDLPGAIDLYHRSIRLNPDFPEAHNNLGNTLMRAGEYDTAIAEYRRAIALNPAYTEAVNNLGTALSHVGRATEALAQFQQAIALNPRFADAHNNLGYAYDRLGRYPEAIAEYEKAIALQPTYAQAMNNLAYLLAACPRLSFRDGPRALALAQRANQLTGSANPLLLATLAAAYAQTGHFPEAIQTAEQAIHRSEILQAADLTALLSKQLSLYQSNQPLPDNE